MLRSLSIERPPRGIPASAMIESVHWAGRLAGTEEAFALLWSMRDLERLCGMDGPVSVHFAGTRATRSLQSHPGCTIFVTVHPVLARDEAGCWRLLCSQSIPDGALVCLRA